MKNILLLFVLTVMVCKIGIAQTDSLSIGEIQLVLMKLEIQNKEIEDLTLALDTIKTQLNHYKSALNRITLKAQRHESEIDNLSKLIEINRSNTITAADEIGNKIIEIGQIAETKISELGGDVEKNRLYWIIATLVTLLLGALMYFFLGKRIKSSKTDVETQIRNTKKSLEEESLKLDNKLIEVLETQLKVQQEESKSQLITTNEKADHSLALKVADEIVRMQKNISRMDADIKGLKPLEKGIERIQANFAANGYEMVNLLNNEYDERMNIDVINFVEDDTLESGKKIISKIIKPQVNFNGILIQRAQVEVSQN